MGTLIRTFSQISRILKILYSIKYKYGRRKNTPTKMQSSNTSSSSGAFDNNKSSQNSGVSSSGSQTSTQEQKSFNDPTNFIQSWDFYTNLVDNYVYEGYFQYILQH